MFGNSIPMSGAERILSWAVIRIMRDVGVMLRWCPSGNSLFSFLLSFFPLLFFILLFFFVTFFRSFFFYVLTLFYDRTLMHIPAGWGTECCHIWPHHQLGQLIAPTPQSWSGGCRVFLNVPCVLLIYKAHLNSECMIHGAQLDSLIPVSRRCRLLLHHSSSSWDEAWVSQRF